MKAANRRRMPPFNNRAHVDVNAYIKRKLQDPEFRAALRQKTSASNWCSRSSNCGSGVA